MNDIPKEVLDPFIWDLDEAVRQGAERLDDRTLASEILRNLPSDRRAKIHGHMALIIIEMEKYGKD